MSPLGVGLKTFGGKVSVQVHPVGVETAVATASPIVRLLKSHRVAVGVETRDHSDAYGRRRLREMIDQPLREFDAPDLVPVKSATNKTFKKP